MTNMTPYEFEKMNRLHGQHVDQTVEEATRLLLQLIGNVEEDISSADLSRHLKDALEEAKIFLGIDTDHEITFKVIAEEWQIDGSSETHTNPMTLYFYMPKVRLSRYGSIRLSGLSQKRATTLPLFWRGHT